MPDQLLGDAHRTTTIASMGARTGVLWVGHHERICADMARPAAPVSWCSVRAFGARGSSTDRQ
jgi:hypothetical protein